MKQLDVDVSKSASIMTFRLTLIHVTFDFDLQTDSNAQ